MMNKLIRDRLTSFFSLVERRLGKCLHGNFYQFVLLNGQEMTIFKSVGNKPKKCTFHFIGTLLIMGKSYGDVKVYTPSGIQLDLDEIKEIFRWMNTMLNYYGASLASMNEGVNFIEKCIEQLNEIIPKSLRTFFLEMESDQGLLCSLCNILGAEVSAILLEEKKIYNEENIDERTVPSLLKTKALWGNQHVFLRKNKKIYNKNMLFGKKIISLNNHSFHGYYTDMKDCPFCKDVMCAYKKKQLNFFLCIKVKLEPGCAMYLITFFPSKRNRKLSLLERKKILDAVGDKLSIQYQHLVYNKEEDTTKRFIQNITNQILMPVQVILSASEIVLSSRFKPKIKHEYIFKMARLSFNLKYLVDAYCWISINFDFQEDINGGDVSLTSLFEHMRFLLGGYFDKNGQQLQIDIKTKLSDIVVDYEYFYHVLYFVLRNASEFSYKNTDIVVECTQCEKFYYFIITSYGIQIENEEKEEVFKYGTRGIHAQEIEETGSGMGLFLVRKILRALGGNIRLKGSMKNGITPRGKVYFENIFEIKLPL